jgi:PKD repeat protein
MNLAGIVHILNVKIHEALNCKTDGGVVYGIAEQTVRKSDTAQQVFPTVYDNHGNGKDVTVDDNYPFIVYHRLLSKSYQYPQVKSFGNPKEYVQETSEITTLVYAKRQYLKINAEQVESIVKLSVPATLNTVQLSDLDLKSCNILHSSSVLDTQTNFSNEYRGFDTFLSSDEIFISLRFTIETVYKKDCLDKFCEAPTKVPSVYLFASEYCVNGSGTIEIGWISYNVDYVTISGLGKRKPIGFENVLITADTTITITAGSETDSIFIEGQCATCLDATAVVKNTLGTIIASESIPSGTTEDIIITDSTAVIKNTLGTTLKTEAIPAEVSENITINNTTVQLKDTASNNIGGVNSYLAESANNLTAPDGTVTVQNTTPTTIATQSVRSNGTATVTLSDIVLTINDQNGNNLSTSNEKAAVNITKAVTVSGALDLTIAASTITPVTNQSITFTGGCTNGTPTNWRWDFGDGTSSTLQNPTKSYRLTGTYTVVLSATDGTNDGFVVFASTITVTLQPLITTNLQANYDANNYDAATGTQTDSTANAFNLTQGVVANRPSKTVGGLNGRDYITFDGSNDFLANASLSFTRATGHTVVSVIRRLRIGTLSQEWVYRSNSTPIAGVTPSFIAGNGAIPNTYVLFAGFLTNPNTPILNDWEIVIDAFNDAASAIKINNTTELLVGNAGNTAATGLQESSATNPSNYDRATRLVYTDIKSSTDIDSIIQHLQAKYNLY